MPKLIDRFKSCGRDVRIEDNVYIEHPEVMEVGDRVTFMSGFYMIGKLAVCKIGSDVMFYPNCFIQGNKGRLVIDGQIVFFPGNYISVGESSSSFVEIGSHSHFAPNCVLYGWGGLKFGKYSNIAAHSVFATVGHHHEITDVPMANSGEKTGPITIEDDVWVAANVTITANTKIASGCVIAANAVVTKDTVSMGIYAGVPAKRIRSRSNPSEG